MKKLIVVLSMITCMCGMTACGNAETYTEQEEQKISNAANYATNYVVPFFINEAVEYDAETLAEEFTNDEIADIYSLYATEVNERISLANEIVQAATSYGITPQDFVTMLSQQGGQDYSEMLNYLGTTASGSSFETTGSIVKSGIASMDAGFDLIGTFDITSVGEATAKIDHETIIVSFPVKVDSKSAEIEVILSNDKFLALESFAFNMEYSFGETMAKAGQNTLVGIGTVFVVLILISFLISLFRFIPMMQEKMAKKKETSNAEAMDKAVSQIAEKEEAVEEEDLTDDLELVAVIAAAIAASEGQATTDGFVVRSIRKVNRR